MCGGLASSSFVEELDDMFRFFYKQACDERPIVLCFYLVRPLQEAFGQGLMGAEAAL